MKHNIKYVISLVFMLLLTQGAWADPTVTIIKQLNGSPAATASPGEVTSEIANGKCTLMVTPAEGNYVTKDFITVYSVVTGNVAQSPRRSPNLDNDPIEVTDKGANTDPTGVTTYEFTMPTDGSDAEVTVNFHSITTYDLFIGETQVTVLNAADVLGNGKVSFTSVLNNQVITNTLTLNGAELTVPVKVGLDNLTIDIQGKNSITTAETCLQKMENSSPAVTFKSTSSPVGSLALKGSSGVYGVGYGTFSISDQFAVILKKDGLYYSDQYYMTDGSTKEVILAPSYGLTVGGMQIYEGNATDVIGYGIGDGQQVGMVSFNKATSTLTLKNANLSGIIRSSLPNLIIELDGNSSISSGAPRTLQAGSAVHMTIQSTAGNGSLSMHKSYSSSELGNFVDDNVNLTITTPLSVISGSLTSDATENDYYATIGVNYDLWISGTRVTSANASNIWDGTDFEFDAENSILYYRNGESTAYPILSGLPNLTIKIGSPDAEGGYAKNNIGVIKFGAPEGETIAATSGTLTISKILDDAETVQQFQIVGSGQESNIIQGFTTVDYSDFVPMADGITYNTGTKKLVDASGNDWGTTTTFVTSNGIELPAPVMAGEVVDGVDGISLILSTDLGTIKYSVDYVDSDEADITDATYDDNNKPTISKPATVTAYVTLNGYNSTTTKGKYFDSNPNPFKLVYGADAVDLVLTPEIEEGDGISILGIEANVSYEAGKISSSTVGNFGGPVAMSATEGKTVILNNYFTMNFEVVPPAPTITSSATLEGDAITIESTVAGADIYYSWSADDNTGTLYTTTAPTAKTGTLYAWVKVTTENGTVTSDKATKEFSVKTNIANAAVVGLENKTYTGVAITPSFTVKATAEAEDNLVAGTDYEVSYEVAEVAQPQGAPSRRAPESVEIKDAGLYNIIITGKGNYGGTKTVQFIVNQASLANVTIADIDAVTYNGADQKPTAVSVTLGGNAVATTEYTISYKQGEDVVESAVDAGTYTVVLTSTNKNFATTATATTDFVIGQKTLTEDMVTLSDESFEYYGETWTPDVTVIDGDNELEVGEDYELTNDGGVDVGTYEVTVIGIGNYTGEVTKTFEITNRTLVVGEDVQFAANQKWASFYNTEESLELPQGVMAYIVTAVDDTKATLTAINYVPKDEPVFLENNSTTTTTNSSAYGNLLTGIDDDTNVSELNGTVYGLHNNVLMKITTGSIPGGRAILVVNGEQSAPRLALEKDDSVTGIENLTTTLSEGEEVWYSLDGKKLQQKPTTKGIYIVNGKKMVIK